MLAEESVMSDERQEEGQEPTPQGPGESGIAGTELEKLRAEVQEYKDRYLRTAAEIENTRRRADRERAELLKYGLERVLHDLVPVLDTFDKALTTPGAEEGHPLADGIRMIRRQFLDTLSRHGLEVVKAAGQKFDPNVHQAIQRIESDKVEHEMVDVEYAAGYTLHGRLVRPAMVSVLVPAGST